MERSRIVLVLGITAIMFAGVAVLLIWRPDFSPVEVGALVTVLALAVERVAKLTE